MLKTIDSYSTCTSLKNKNNKLYEKQIKNKIKQNPNKNFTIQWILGHINFQGNDKAKMAKMAKIYLNYHQPLYVMNI